MAAAIHERRLLSITYAGALEPQLFAPSTLYVSTANRLLVDGYELNGRRLRWRNVDLDTVRDVLPAEDTYAMPEPPVPALQTYPRGTVVLARAWVDAGQHEAASPRASLATPS
jgi:hypothetical protein